jgi:hypothetical protein
LKIKIYKILPPVLYRCETWSLTLREDRRLRVFKNRDFSEYLGTRGMRIGSVEVFTMNNFIVYTVYLVYLGSKSRKLRCAGHIVRMEEGRSSFKMLTGTSTEKRPLGWPGRRWEDNIRIDLKEIGINTRSWVN